MLCLLRLCCMLPIGTPIGMLAVALACNCALVHQSTCLLGQVWQAPSVTTLGMLAIANFKVTVTINYIHTMRILLWVHLLPSDKSHDVYWFVYICT